ncbi:hypothetical protein D9611_014435 [Ephemerocybe angulata]|uniref:Uncharacterized protein n=1 Tax=Ephemerocybe angulata TaxID=980116 RepID=A0A8H5ARU3_9AGAR|nr:hypothetical protein D9611_014435 [Tulosesus angulatus]
MYTESALLDISRSFDEARQVGLFSTVKACVVGALCKKPLIVSVAVHPGFESSPRNIDLYVEPYLHDASVTVPALAPFTQLEDAGACIRRYPRGAPREQRNHWSIFRVSPGGRGGANLPVNERYESYKCSDAVRTVWGNIVVVKSDRLGTVCDMEAVDLGLAEFLVYSYIEDDAIYDHPLIVDPLVIPVERALSSGWGE